MGSFLIAVNAILPITAMILLGVLTGRTGMISKQSFREFNRFVFRFSLPLTLFMNIVSADLRSMMDPKLILYCFVCITATALAGMLVMRRSSLPDSKKGVIVQDLIRGNFVILGPPLVQSIYGDAAAGIPSLLAAWFVPYFNLAATLILERYSGEKTDLAHTVIHVLKNPMIMAALAAIFLQLLHISLPSMVMNVLTTANRMTTPLALFVLGGLFEFSSLRENAKILSVFCFVRLIVLPLIALTGAVMLGYREAVLVSILVLMGGPIAVSSYAMSVEMKGDGDLAAQIILVSTILVIPTFIAGITILGTLGYL
ncbi:MAG: AEC family transporter [Solobacterium sp.]|nr:AEC family transporter [Solobacterium sp.]